MEANQLNKKRVYVTIVAILVLLALLGYVAYAVNMRSQKTPVQQESVQTNEIEGTWTWRETLMNDDTTVAPRDGEAFTITLNSDGTFSGTTDCNSIMGSYTLEESDIEFGPIGMTKMFCPDSQEGEFTKALDEVNKVYFTEEGRLVLLFPYDSGSMIFEK